VGRRTSSAPETARDESRNVGNQVSLTLKVAKLVIGGGRRENAAQGDGLKMVENRPAIVVGKTTSEPPCDVDRGRVEGYCLGVCLEGGTGEPLPSVG